MKSPRSSTEATAAYSKTINQAAILFRGDGMTYYDDDRYPNDWGTRRNITRSLTLHRCCDCWWRKAQDTHHLFYPPYFLQQPLISLVGLCDYCHSNRRGKAHNLKLYKTYKHNPRLNHNTLAYSIPIRLKMLTLLAIIWLGIPSLLFGASFQIGAQLRVQGLSSVLPHEANRVLPHPRGSR